MYLYLSKIRDDGKAPIYIKIKNCGPVKQVSAGQWVLPKDWNNESKSVKIKADNAATINKKIAVVTDELDRIFTALSLEKDFVSAQEIKDAFEKRQEKNNPKSVKKDKPKISETVDEFLNLVKNLFAEQKR